MGQRLNRQGNNCSWKFAGAWLALLVVMTNQSRMIAADDETHPDYYPLKAGTKWHYRMLHPDGSIGTFVSQVAKIDHINNLPLSRREAKMQGALMATEHLISEKNGVFRHRFNGMEVNPPICILKYPLKCGEWWESETTIDANKIKVIGRASDGVAEVPAGKFKAVIVTIEGTVETKDGDLMLPSVKLWLAPGMGPVKQIVNKTITFELEKFEDDTGSKPSELRNDKGGALLKPSALEKENDGTRFKPLILDHLSVGS